MSPDSDDLEAGIQRHMDNWERSSPISWNNVFNSIGVPPPTSSPLSLYRHTPRDPPLMVSPLMPFTPVKIRNGRRPITPRSIPVSTLRKRRLAEVAWDATRSPLLLPRNMKAREPASQLEIEEGSPKGRARKRIKAEIGKEETPKVTKAETKKETHEKSGQELHKSHKKDGGSSDSEKCKVESG